MIYDRPYMSTSYHQRFKNALFWIIGANIAVFVLQNLFPLFGWNFLGNLFALRVDSLVQGYIWTPITYSFLHSINPIHIIANMLGVFFLGRVLLPDLGTKRFLQLYLGAALIGGLFWNLSALALHDLSAIRNLPEGAIPRVIGASGSVFGLLTVFACLYPNREIQVLLMFIIPVRIKPKTLAFIALGFSVFAYLFYELLGSSATAHSAHLGGMLGGWLFFKYLHRPGFVGRSDGISIKMPDWLKKKKASPKPSRKYDYKVNISSKPRDLKLEVDRILDKINTEGFGSLTPREKQILDEAGDLLKRR